MNIHSTIKQEVNNKMQDYLNTSTMQTIKTVFQKNNTLFFEIVIF